MIPFFNLKTGCFTKHPLKNGCLGFQDDSYWNEVYIQRRKGLGIGGNAVKNSRKCCRYNLVCLHVSLQEKHGLKTVEFFRVFFWETHHVFLMLEIAVLNPNPPEHQSQNPPNLDHLVTTMGLDIFGTLENTKLVSVFFPAAGTVVFDRGK